MSSVETQEWIDYPWEMGLTEAEIFDKKTVRAIVRSMVTAHYTYVLWRYKSKKLEPFYVGKGYGNRVLNHGRASEHKNNPHKGRVMAKALKDGWVGYSFKIFSTGQEALEKEAEWVELIGTVKDRTGPLTNLKDGGLHGGGQKRPEGWISPCAKKITVDGVEYESMTAAAKAHNINIGSVRHRCEHGLWPEWSMEGINKKRAIGARKPASPVIIDGVQYKNSHEAARILDIHFNTVRYRCTSPSYPNWVRVLSPQKINLKPKVKMVRVLAEGVLYESITAAARAYGIGVNSMRFRCEDSRFDQFEYKGSNRCPE